MKDLVIELKNVKKTYKLYDNSMDRLKEALNPFRKKYHSEFTAVENANFRIYKGETIGIIGKNGSGKSTLLKLITGVLIPTSGTVNVKGKIAALLELGAGFNMEYTGIENIYLNGLMMGYTREEMNFKLDKIIDFAGIGDFIQQPVKTYSSGMFARLAFALSINVEPDILIVDEALSVGDIFFQNKCFSKIEELQSKGTTIIFVSHDISSVKQLCSRVMWLDNGKIIAFDDTKTVCELYLDSQINEHNNYEETFKASQNENDDLDHRLENVEVEYMVPKLNEDILLSGNHDADICSFYISDTDGRKTNVLEVDKEYEFHIIAKINRYIKEPILGFTIENNRGIYILSMNTYINDIKIEELNTGDYVEAIFRVKLPKIQEGNYLISPAIATGTQNHHKVLSWGHNIETITIVNNGYNLSLIELDSEIVVRKHKKLKFY